MGRGGGIKERKTFSSKVRRVDGIPAVYIPFTSIPLFSQMLSSLGLAYVICKLRFRGANHIIFYNRTPTFIPSLLVSTAFGYKNTLDLEDGEVSQNRHLVAKAFFKMVTYLFDKLCSRALLACSALKSFTLIRQTLCYYGAVFNFSAKKKFQSKRITILISGTLCHDTGANLLIKTIKRISLGNPPWAENIQFEITGKGESLVDFQKLASEIPHPEIIVHGRLSKLDYESVLNRADIGLSLKLNYVPYSNTTFSTKVVEYESAGLLVLTTDISDVRMVLGDGAIYLASDDPLELMMRLEFIANDRQRAKLYSERGYELIQEQCAPKIVGNKLVNFIYK